MGVGDAGASVISPVQQHRPSASTMPINVSIVEDDNRIRESLAVLIDGGGNFRCISAHPTAEDALKNIPLKKPDVVLMDINLPNMSGVECVRKLKALMPNLQILMLTMYDDDDQVFQSLMAGASGYLVKRTSPGDILKALEEVHAGSSPMSGKIARTVVEYFQKLQAASAGPEQLSRREQELLDLLVKGYRDKEIAEALSISFETVRSHLKNIYEKLHVHSRTEAVVKYLHK
ncbi:MAG TPA: response regulator transcription factor [Verrucomicrobiae bacterium]|nr:response regulator transcription factor [Verrucomicrobiae bacterium]